MKVRVVHWAAAVSLLFHMVLVFAPAWHLPARNEPIRIEASLLKSPAVRSAALEPSQSPKVPATEARKPPPKQIAKAASVGEGARPAVIARAPVSSEADEDLEPQDEGGGGGEKPSPYGRETVTDPGVIMAPEGSPVGIDPQATQAWPKQGRVRFQVRYGEAVAVGEMVHTWSHDGERYTMRSEAATTGLARFVKRFDGVQQSQGRVGPQGLAPNGFQEDLNGKQSHAVFDWSQRRVVMQRPDRVREVSFQGFAQDILSLAHHLGFQPDGMEQTTLYVVGGRWGAEATLTQVANERLRLPWGTIETRHFNCVARNGEFVVDLWLSRQHRNAPVRIRVDDRKQGHVVDEIALEIELDGVKADIAPSRETEEMYKG
ncbi:DUF3108 domain-containing protein [Niveibacterium sp. 24ML]|uniref:DUF3108 domain-containing protein n=1 Tax=Niveibacterium sp. 24ML TaxID=2985512 RepID=UPI002271BE80|nr:DUF3108 domain-containing protein [Niveibacterium sp. 24ML]MCX9156086.1 DUF3108 domain-containing protein [Niveibacterium sp. 24ML]